MMCQECEEERAETMVRYQWNFQITCKSCAYDLVKDGGATAIRSIPVTRFIPGRN